MKENTSYSMACLILTFAPNHDMLLAKCLND